MDPLSKVAHTADTRDALCINQASKFYPTLCKGGSANQQTFPAKKLQASHFLANFVEGSRPIRSRA